MGVAKYQRSVLTAVHQLGAGLQLAGAGLGAVWLAQAGGGWCEQPLKSQTSKERCSGPHGPSGLESLQRRSPDTMKSTGELHV